MEAVIDTNVLVAAIMNPCGSPAVIIEMVIAGQLVPIYDDRIILEYENVLKTDFTRDEFP